jgi:uncharacterized membrane protein
MTTKHKALIAMTTVFLLVLAVTLTASTQQFTFTTIDVPTASSTILGGIANNGELVGSYFDQNLVKHGFLRSPTGTLNFPFDYVNPNPLVTVVGTSLHRIDSQSQYVAGSWMDGASLEHGLVIELGSNKGVSFDFPAPGVGTDRGTATFVNGINRNGEISGGYVDSALNEHGFTANLSLDQVIGFQSVDFPAALLTELGNVNDNGDIVGFYLAADGNVISFLSRGGISESCASCTSLSSPSGAAVFARGINNSQQIVGFESNSIALRASLTGLLNGLFKVSGSNRGFFLNSPTAQATIVNFPGPDAQQTGVGSINDSGIIAGQYNSPGFVTHGFIAVPTN